jgi:hypothetical protein
VEDNYPLTVSATTINSTTKAPEAVAIKQFWHSGAFIASRQGVNGDDSKGAIWSRNEVNSKRSCESETPLSPLQLRSRFKFRLSRDKPRKQVFPVLSGFKPMYPARMESLIKKMSSQESHQTLSSSRRTCGAGGKSAMSGAIVMIASACSLNKTTSDSASIHR